MSPAWLPRAEPVDDDTVLNLLTASARHDLLAGGLPADVVDGLATMQARARMFGHRQEFPDAQQRCVVEGEQLVGRVLVDQPADGSWHLVDVVVHPESRRCGLARWMVGAVVAEADRARASMTLSAVPGAPVVALYTSLGFTEIAANPTTVVLHRRHHE